MKILQESTERRTRPAIPPLHPGDHLTAEEFMRRYEAMPHLKKAELIDGVVFMPSPVTIDEHGTPHTLMMGWLAFYWGQTPGVQPGANSTVLLDLGSRPQPDGLLRILPSHGGQSSTEGNYVVGAPEWVGEITASTASYDLFEKLQAYKRNQVREYLIWRVEDKALDWFVLKGDDFKKMAPSGDGYLKSKVFPGLWLDPKAALSLNMAKVLKVLQLGLASKEHARFVEKLSKQKA